MWIFLGGQLSWLGSFKQSFRDAGSFHVMVLQLLYMGDIKVVQPEDRERGRGGGGGRGENTETMYSLN